MPLQHMEIVYYVAAARSAIDRRQYRAAEVYIGILAGWRLVPRWVMRYQDSTPRYTCDQAAAATLYTKMPQQPIDALAPLDICEKFLSHVEKVNRITL